MNTAHWAPVVVVVALSACGGAPPRPASPASSETTRAAVASTPEPDLVAHVEACGDMSDLARACERDCAEACRRRGAELIRGGEPADEAQGLDLLSRGCDLDDALACAALGALAFERDGSGIAHLTKACELGQAAACGVAGLARQDLAMATRACELGNGPGCYFEGMLHFRDEDVAAAGRAFAASCDRGFEHGCFFATLTNAMNDPDAGMDQLRDAVHAGCRAGEPTLCKMIDMLER